MLRFLAPKNLADGRSPIPTMLLLASVAMLPVPSPRAAAEMVLHDPLDYEQPVGGIDVPMDGQRGGIAYGGASWDSPWVASPGGYMFSENNAVQTTGGYEDHYLERELTHNLAPATETWFSGILWRPSEQGYAINYSFPEIDTALELYFNEFRTKLGGTYSPTNGTIPVSTHTDYRVVGRLEFDAVGNQERLSLWVNPQSVGDAPLIQQTADIGATDVGSSVRIFADSQTNETKRWDDLRIGTSYADVVPAAADGLVLAEYFDYDDGTQLHGQNGGFSSDDSTWDSAWTDHGLGGQDQNGNERDFKVTDHAAWIVQSGGDPGTDSFDRAIEREFTADVAPGTTMYLSFIQSKPDGEGGFDIGTTLVGPQVSLGVENNAYRADLDSATATTPAAPFAPNAPDRLLGRLEFNVDGTNQERLTVWVNPAFESDAPTLQLTQDVGTETAGNLLELYYNNGSDGPKHWRDLRLGTDFQSTNSLRVDIGPDGQELEAGYVRWDVGAHGENDATVSRFFRQLGGVTVRLESEDLDTSGDGLDVRTRSSAGGVFDDLKTDGVKEGGVRLIFEGLERGLYELTTFHHDSLTGGNRGDIYLNGAPDPLASVWLSQGNAIPASLTYQIEADSAGYAEMLINSSEVWLNGFELIPLNRTPEPSSLVLLVLGAAVLVVRPRRSRH
jgi:hypothetical protein